jgi:toxin ParE1/3/4
MKLEFHPSAADELVHVIRDYESRRAGLGAELRTEARRVETLLRARPNIGEPINRNVRRFPLRRFPFAFFYRFDSETIRVIAFAHRRRRPNYWRARR